MAILSFLKHFIPSSLKNKLRYHLGVPSQKKSFHKLRDLGFTPTTVLDIGAYEGLWATELQEIFPAARILMIEGQTSKNDVLKKISLDNQGIDYKIALLGATETLAS